MRRIISALLLLALLLTGCGGVSKEEYESGTLLNPEVAFSMYPPASILGEHLTVLSSSVSWGHPCI